MKQNFKLFSILLFLLVSIPSFAQKKTPFQINGELFEVPGKWEYRTQLKESGQFHLTNKSEKISMRISVRKPENSNFIKKA